MDIIAETIAGKLRGGTSTSIHTDSFGLSARLSPGHWARIGRMKFGVLATLIELPALHHERVVNADRR